MWEAISMSREGCILALTVLFVMVVFTVSGGGI